MWKSLISLVKSFSDIFYRHLAIFYWSHCSDVSSEHSTSCQPLPLRVHVSVIVKCDFERKFLVHFKWRNLAKWESDRRQNQSSLKWKKNYRSLSLSFFNFLSSDSDKSWTVCPLFQKWFSLYLGRMRLLKQRCVTQGTLRKVSTKSGSITTRCTT